MKGRRSSM